MLSFILNPHRYLSLGGNYSNTKQATLKKVVVSRPPPTLSSFHYCHTFDHCHYRHLFLFLPIEIEIGEEEMCPESDVQNSNDSKSRLSFGCCCMLRPFTTCIEVVHRKVDGWRWISSLPCYILLLTTNLWGSFKLDLINRLERYSEKNRVYNQIRQNYDSEQGSILRNCKVFRSVYPLVTLTFD